MTGNIAADFSEHFSDPPATGQVKHNIEREPPPINNREDQEKERTRYLKVLAFWDKKQRRSFDKKIVSKKRKKVADNKLRI